jgi:excisionase family DNA binding protein
MASQTVRIEAAARRALRSTFKKVRPDEVLVLVVGPDAGVATRKSLRAKHLDTNTLELLLLGAEAAVDELARNPVAPSPPLTSAEAAVLDAAGLAEEVAGPGEYERSTIAFALLLRQSLTIEKAAKALGVSTSRLRQRLSEHTLYGIKEGRAWRIPRFQLDAKRKNLVHGIEKVLPSVKTDAHPLAVVSWFTSPHQDLVVGDEEAPVTPLQWLSAGRSPSVVAELATEI